MGYDQMDYEKILRVLRASRPCIERAGREAESRHDELGGEFYMDIGQFEIMNESEQLLKDIDAAIAEIETGM